MFKTLTTNKEDSLVFQRHKNIKCWTIPIFRIGLVKAHGGDKGLLYQTVGWRGSRWAGNIGRTTRERSGRERKDKEDKQVKKTSKVEIGHNVRWQWAADLNDWRERYETDRQFHRQSDSNVIICRGSIRLESKRMEPVVKVQPVRERLGPNFLDPDHLLPSANRTRRSD